MIRATSLIFSMLVTAYADDPSMDAGRFSRLITALHSDIEDFELICEGRVLDLTKPEGSQLHNLFQSNYAYRRDGATYWDHYRKPTDANEPFTRSTHAVIRGTHTTDTRAPDLAGNRASRRSGKGSARAVAYDGSPGRFIFLYFWDELFSGTKSIVFKDEGWENIDGHRCLVVSIEEKPQRVNPHFANSPGRMSKFWIDLERGGHALKHEFRVRDALWLRVENIRLSRFTAPSGKPIWFPVHGEVETFPTPGIVDSHFREICDIVAGSLAFNRRLPDKRFSTDWKGAVAETKEFGATRREFERIPPREPLAPKQIAASEAQQDLEHRLAEAEKQARQLDASPPASRTFNALVLTQLGFGAAGTLGLLAALVLRRRSA